MSRFRDPDAAERAIERLGKLTMRPFERLIDSAFEGCPDPDQALVRLERWFKALSNPGTVFDALVGTPGLGRLLVTLLGASHQMADLLAQNPELANLMLDPELLAARITLDKVRENGRRLLAASTSYSHSLDRLRFLKQVSMVRIAAADLGRLWGEEEVWLAISVVAEALLDLARDVVWQAYARERGVEGPCPVSVVGMGKLGGDELNYSSDVDLVYVLDDDADEKTERHAIRFCERYGRALADKMGRGSLYRVDLRLRPFGSTGPIVSRMRAVESYYERYAEAWEHQALIRSRVVSGTPEVAERWEAMRVRTAFQPARTEWAIEQLLGMRDRIEEKGGVEDLKRGAGGIRDVEFLAQILQMIYGFTYPQLREPGTCGTLRTLTEVGLLPGEVGPDLLEGYTFLRQVEHRRQIVGGLQTHALPTQALERETLAREMGFGSVHAFDAALGLHRTRIRHWYQFMLRRGDEAEPSARDEVARRVGLQALAWIDGLPDAEAFYASLVENEGSLKRVALLVDAAPALVPSLRDDLATTEQVITGEVAEEFDLGDRLGDLAERGEWEGLAKALNRSWLRLAARWVLVGDIEFGLRMSELLELAFRAILTGLGARFEALVLGSCASGDVGLYSDADLVFLLPDGGDIQQAEQTARRFLATVQSLRQYDSPLMVDLRLRPEGRRGLLVRTYEGVRRYERGPMEPWERFALGRARQVYGQGEALELARQASYGRPLSTEDLESLLRLKERIETERVRPSERTRNVKLGHGGLDDVDWTIQLLLLRHPEVALGCESVRAADRLKALERAGLLGADTVGELAEARRFLLETRLRLPLLGLEDDVIPDGADKLAHLAATFGFGSPQEYLAEFEVRRAAVRAAYEATVGRLRG